MNEVLMWRLMINFDYNCWERETGVSRDLKSSPSPSVSAATSSTADETRAVGWWASVFPWSYDRSCRTHCQDLRKKIAIFNRPLLLSLNSVPAKRWPSKRSISRRARLSIPHRISSRQRSSHSSDSDRCRRLDDPRVSVGSGVYL